MGRSGGVVEEGKGDAHEREVTGGGNFNFEPYRLGFLFGLDEDVATSWASFGFLGMKGYS